jgi:hypothetical protein
MQSISGGSVLVCETIRHSGGHAAGTRRYSAAYISTWILSLSSLADYLRRQPSVRLPVILFLLLEQRQEANVINTQALIVSNALLPLPSLFYTNSPL